MNAHDAQQGGDDPDAQRFVVTYQKQSGATMVYGRYADRSEADRVASLLRWAGAIANVQVAT